MKDADLKRNASGYYDETAYKAITAPPKAGEIWQYKMTGAYMLVLGGNEKVTSCLKLVKTPIDPDGMFPLEIGKEILYTDPVMIGYTFNDKLDSYVTKLHPEQMKAVQKEVGKYLGIPNLEDRNAELLNERDNLLLENGDLRRENKKITFDLDAKILADKMVADSIADMEQEIYKLKVYKDMYMDLIDKLVAVRGGAVFDKTGIQ